MTIEIKLDYLPGHKNNQCFNVSILVFGTGHTFTYFMVKSTEQLCRHISIEE